MMNSLNRSATLRGLLAFSMLVITVLLPVTQAQAQASTKVDNFVLIDHQGSAHELYYHRRAPAIVLMVHGNGCQIVRSNLAEFQQVKEQFAPQGVKFFMLNANLQDTRAAIAEEAAEWGIETPILHDTAQIIGRSLGLVRTGEVLVINPQTWQIEYRGALSDRVDYERQKNTAKNEYVKDALTSVLAGKDLAVREVVAPGCIINYDEADSVPDYAADVAPVLQKNCMACHVDGGIAPWAMTEYNMVKGFAPMIREVLRTKRMPPWHSDPEVGHWQQNKAISQADLRTLISWIEAGAPRGEGDDPLLDSEPLANEWTLGEPDLIVEIPAFEVPATGIVDYQFPVVENPLDKDVWVIGASIIPGDTKAVHHILAGSSAEAPKQEGIENIFENFILTYAPGNESNFMPEGTGVFVPKGGVYQFQMHYTPYGKKAVDKSKIGLYFSDTPPQNFYREHVLVNPALKIPANAAAHEEKAYFKFWEDATIYALFPHAHYRGKSSRFDLEFPDGSTETLLSVPNYDFNWQRTYALQEPRDVPAGTRIIHRTIYDNSQDNRGNPAPDSDVYWGLQSEQEMLYGSMGYSWKKETTAQPIHKGGLNDVLQVMGFRDQDMNELITEDELGGRTRRAIGENFDSFDKDGDGGLNVREFSAMLSALRAG